ncbi:lysozyme-like [Ostrinia furnacalis]|uniref:lysozyme-like n=1 Tax=Ostrinia furnacalis TaxID=93504 RepID=UPI00103FC051|nr:lysozyme-like [Ostrinia furnacalis]
MARFVLFATVQLCVILLCQGRTMDRCQIARELNNHGFPRHQLADWVCLVEAESSGRTEVVGGPNTDGSHDHGLFQINDRYWCENGPNPGKECNVRCSDITQDDISAAVGCAKKIFGQRGFQAWVAWVNKCQGKALPDLGSCGL